MSHRQAFPEPGHDHDTCVSDALANAEAHCQMNQARLTSQRRRILEIIWQSHKPVGAYDILEILNADSIRKAAPMTIYRALDFLMEHGLVHRLASQNAYLGCDHPNADHTSYFLICSNCGRAGEMEDDSIEEAIRISALQNGFKVENQLVEVEGLCPACGPSQ
ncbi:MAG: Fur family transcriptional regulator [Rhodospirillaceae bacterium]|nr:Fur family transcriptional regulator [Rhodospirillaceae bacterium]|tara:strand:- start:869 stop:1357 length:489 start_codon:yes stop_codon:yes gene_type:complete